MTNYQKRLLIAILVDIANAIFWRVSKDAANRIRGKITELEGTFEDERT